MKLRPYQEEDVAKLLSLSAAGIFNEQRTGKTPTAVTVVHRAKCSKVLVVCPKSAIPAWANEYTKWTNGRPSYIIDGTPIKKKETIELWNKGALIISYDSLKKTKTREGLVDLILDKGINALICDEAHRLKDPTSANFKAIEKFTKKVSRRLYLTGTPAPGKQVEIYSLLHFISPDQYRSYWNFKRDYFKQEIIYVKGRNGEVKTISEPTTLLPSAQKEIYDFLDTYTTQRKRKDVMQWLPDKEYKDIKLEPTKLQQKYIKELEEYFETGDVITQGILDRLIRVRQICSDPGLLELKGKSPKTQWVLDFLEDYPDKKIIIFSKFTSYLERLGSVLKCNYGMITGKVPLEIRKEVCEQFQQKDLNVLLINIDAGKEALTLDSATVTIFLDVYPPASDIQQAEDRFVATTVDKADKEHTIYRVMLKGTYDEQIYQLIEKNASLTDLINDYKRYIQR